MFGTVALPLHCVRAVVWVTDGQMLLSALETDVYRAVPVSVPTLTGDEPMETVATAPCGVQFGIEVQESSLMTTGAHTWQAAIFVEAGPSVVVGAMAAVPGQPV